MLPKVGADCVDGRRDALVALERNTAVGSGGVEVGCQLLQRGERGGRVTPGRCLGDDEGALLKLRRGVGPELGGGAAAARQAQGEYAAGEGNRRPPKSTPQGEGARSHGSTLFCSSTR